MAGRPMPLIACNGVSCAGGQSAQAAGTVASSAASSTARVPVRDFHGASDGKTAASRAALGRVAPGACSEERGGVLGVLFLNQCTMPIFQAWFPTDRKSVV